MSMTEKKWEPGDVALVQWSRNPEGAIYMRVDSSTLGHVWWGPDGWIGDATARSVRPLVVIDPEDDGQTGAIVEAFVEAGCWKVIPADVADSHAYRRLQVQAALRNLANPTPPIEEPTGLGAVVECEDGSTYVRTHLTVRNPWTRAGFGQPATWDSINATRVLSEGVPTEAVR